MYVFIVIPNAKFISYCNGLDNICLFKIIIVIIIINLRDQTY
jgi:hypothetical protein